MILDDLKVNYRKMDGCYVLEDNGGEIFEEDDYLFFVHGNTTVRIRKDYNELEKYISAYIDGFEEFNNILMAAG